MESKPFSSFSGGTEVNSMYSWNVVMLVIKIDCYRNCGVWSAYEFVKFDLNICWPSLDFREKYAVNFSPVISRSQ